MDFQAGSSPCEGTSRSASQPELKGLTNWLSLFVHCRSLRDSPAPCSEAAPQPQFAPVNYHSAFGIRQCAACHHCSSSHLRVRHWVHLVVWKMTPRTSRLHVLTTSPRLPGIDRPKHFFYSFSVLLRSTDQGVPHVCASFSGVSRDTDQGVEACVQVSVTRLEPTAMGGELWIACEGTGVSTGGRAHGSQFFCGSDQGVHDVSTSFWPTIMLGSVHDGQQAVILRVSAMKR